MTDTKSAANAATAAKAQPEANAGPTLVIVEAVKSEREWNHKNKRMEPGQRAEVTLAQAAKLEKSGVARLVRDGTLNTPGAPVTT